MKILWRISIKEDDPDHMKTLFSGKFGDDLTSVGEAKDTFKSIRDMGIKL
jgi:hypothetical protein